MPAYHSAFNDDPSVRQIGNLAILPFTSRIRGPAPHPPADPDYTDIISEALLLFRPNSLFRNFEIKGAADRLLIYLILFISDCLSKLAAARSPPQQEAAKVLQSLAVDGFPLPGEAGFPLNSLYAPPGSKADADYLRSYLSQARQETVLRLLPILYPADSDGKPSKWWMAFTKRKFMGRAMSVSAA